MVVFDTMMMACSVHEIQQTLLGARVEKITQPTEYGTQWTFYINGRKHTLFCETDASSSRISISNRGLASPPTPPMYCMLLRKLLSGAYIDSVTPPRGMGERIIRIDFFADNVKYHQ
jgi:predicted ribosome quality control (RQC) complex YloA/Tae2 family protein